MSVPPVKPLLMASPTKPVASYGNGRGPRVIVVGSGFAGLAAARSLADRGIDILVLESRDRIGGRAHTDYSFGFPVDLGAAWLHGASLENPLAPLIGHLRLPLYKTSEDDSVLYDHDFESFALFTKSGHKVPHGDVVKVERVFEEMLKEAGKLFDGFPHDISMAKALDLVAKRRPDLKLAGVEAEVLQWFLCRMEGWFATDMENLSAKHWGEEKLIEGGHGLVIHGYRPVLDALAKNIPVLFNQRVSAVEYSKLGVRLQTTAGTSFSADAAVLTIPVGVLQSEKHGPHFHPPLPRSKQQAIRDIGAGIENKVALLFSSPFWPSVEFLGLVGPSSHDCGYFLNLHRATGAPVLVFMPAGRLATELEGKSDEETVGYTMGFLRKILPQAPEPVKSMVTRWGQDPSSLMAYTFDKVGASMDVHDALRAPVKNTLYFAGEATSRDYPGTVHGAFETGVQAAAECFRSLSERGLFAQETVLEVAPAASLVSEGKDRVPVIMARL